MPCANGSWTVQSWNRILTMAICWLIWFRAQSCWHHAFPRRIWDFEHGRSPNGLVLMLRDAACLKKVQEEDNVMKKTKDSNDRGWKMPTILQLKQMALLECVHSGEWRISAWCSCISPTSVAPCCWERLTMSSYFFHFRHVFFPQSNSTP